MLPSVAIFVAIFSTLFINGSERNFAALLLKEFLEIQLILWRASMKLPVVSSFEVVAVVKSCYELALFYPVEVECPFDVDTVHCHRNTCTLLFYAIYNFLN